MGAAFVYGQTEPPKNSPKVPSTPKVSSHGDISTPSSNLDDGTHSRSNLDVSTIGVTPNTPTTLPRTTRGSSGTTIGGSGTAAFKHNTPAHTMGGNSSIHGGSINTTGIMKRGTTSPSAATQWIPDKWNRWQKCGYRNR